MGQYFLSSPVSSPGTTPIPITPITPPSIGHNTPPKIYPLKNILQILYQYKYFKIRIVVVDRDGDTVQVSMRDLPEGVSYRCYRFLRSNTTLCNLYGKVQKSGIYRFTVTAVDIRGGRSSKRYWLVVLPAKPNTPPHIYPRRRLWRVVFKNRYFRDNIFVVDAEGYDLKINISGLPYGVWAWFQQMDVGQYNIQVRGATRKPGIYNIKVEAKDSHGLKTVKKYWLLVLR